MAVQWIRLERSAAEAHPLYGVGGWLLTILLLHSLGLFLTVVVEWSGLVHSVRMLSVLATHAPFMGFLLLLTLLTVVLGAWMLFQGFAVRAGFRATAIWLMALTIAVKLAMLLYLATLSGPANADELLREVLQLAFSGATLAYFIGSRRVRVTYLWQVVPDDPILGAAPAPSAGKATPDGDLRQPG